MEIFSDFSKKIGDMSPEERHTKRLVMEERIYTILKNKYLDYFRNWWLNYTVPKVSDKSIVIVERQIHPNLEFILYNAPLDTTFCLINNTVSGYPNDIRVSGNFTAKHLPWYNDYLKTNIPKEELVVWVKNNKSSSILKYIDINNLLE